MLTLGIIQASLILLSLNRIFDCKISAFLLKVFAKNGIIVYGFVTYRFQAPKEDVKTQDAGPLVDLHLI